VSEFELINEYFKSSTVQRDDVLLGIGDDCAILSPPPGKQLAVSTDTLISGVHFPNNTSAENIGYKSLAVNLSDLAAMGAEPAWVSLAISLPEADETWISEFMQGFNQLALKHNVALIGGDTTCGPLSITVSVTGFVDTAKSLKRSNAKVGDIIFVTGNLGDARLGLESLLGNVSIPDADAKSYFLSRLNKPEPKVTIGQLLTNYPVAAIDLSDGLLADLNHICTASSMGAVIQLDKIPLSEEFLNSSNNEPNWSMVCNAGDDYELCFTCPPESIDSLLNDLNEHGIEVFPIGEIDKSCEVTCYLNGDQYSHIGSGYNHFK
jgi:thiamine-monophosphate kinase